MITIKKSETADTRTCDYSQVSKEQLLKSSNQHIGDVIRGLNFFQKQLELAGKRHDFDKIEDIDGFYRDFVTGFKSTIWWDNHRLVNRHHLNSEDGVPDFVTLIDVIEYITDCVMAGTARSGSVRLPLEIKPEVLQRAYENTINWLISNTNLEE